VSVALSATGTRHLVRRNDMSRGGADAVTVLSVYLVLLVGVPSNLTIAALGAVGKPALLWGLGCALWWLWTRISRLVAVAGRRQPVRIALAAFAAASLVAYIAAHVHGLPAGEASPSDTALLRLVSWAGVVLVANDGITERNRFTTLLRRIAFAGGFIATLGLLQFVTGHPLIVDVGLPGFTFDPTMGGVQERSGFTRASGTASHPLEYAVMLAVALPIAITLALETREHGVIRRWFSTAVMAVTSVVSISRSAVLGVLVSLAVLAPTWPRAVRRGAVAAGVILLGAIYTLVPGMIGTIRALFLGLSDDPSTVSRTSSYEIALDIADRYAPIGRGLGTFLPAYRILDNQYLQLLIETGIIGLASLLVLFVSAAACARIARRHAVTTVDRQLCQSLLAAVIAAALLFAFFDAFAFPIASGVTFLIIGLCGAARNVFAPDDDGQPRN